MRGRIKWMAVGALAACVSGFASANPNFDDEYDAKPWTEVEVVLPPYPQEADLLSFRVGAVRDTQFMVDTKSVSIGSDGVVRYTLVVIGSGGARNVSYEGLRCATGERRFYAFGRLDKTWGKARTNQWTAIRGGTNNHHVELYKSYVCDVGVPVFAPEDILRRMRSKAQIDFGK